MKTIELNPKSAFEKLLYVLPKKCKCPVCETTKSKAKAAVGDSQYFKLVRKLGFIS